MVTRLHASRRSALSFYFRALNPRTWVLSVNWAGFLSWHGIFLFWQRSRPAQIRPQRRKSCHDFLLHCRYSGCRKYRSRRKGSLGASRLRKCSLCRSRSHDLAALRAETPLEGPSLARDWCLPSEQRPYRCIPRRFAMAAASVTRRFARYRRPSSTALRHSQPRGGGNLANVDTGVWRNGSCLRTTLSRIVPAR